MNLYKEAYRRLRKTIRSNVFLTAASVSSKKFALCNEEVDVLVGGVITKRSEFIEHVGKNGKVQISRLCTKEGIEKAEICQGSRLYFDSNWIVQQIQLSVYDGSGTFILGGFREDQTTDTRRRLFTAKEGDLIFALGRVVCLNSREGYFIVPSMLFNLEECSFYKDVYADKWAALRRKTEVIRRSVPTENIADGIWNASGISEILRYYIVENPELKDLDYYPLCSIVAELFIKHPSGRLASLLVRYYKKVLVSSDGSLRDKAAWLEDFINDTCGSDPRLRQYFSNKQEEQC